MGGWMDQQLRIGESSHTRFPESDISTEGHSTSNGEDAAVADYDFHPEVNSEFSDATTLEQRRAYKMELQVNFRLWG